MTITIPPGFRTLPLPTIQLSLAAVLKCGQSFRWSVFPLSLGDSTNDLSNTPSHPQYEYRLCLRDRVVCLRQVSEILFYRSVFPGPAPTPPEEDLREAETLAWLRDYFQLDVDLAELYEQWGSRDPIFQRLRGRFEGIRMLRQDPFECLISFICSSNNNIARITKMIKSLCAYYSPPLLTLPPPIYPALASLSSPSSSSEVAAHEAYHPFPSPSVLAAPEVPTTLRSLGFGYRAEFIQKTAKMLVDMHGTPSNSESSDPVDIWLRSLRDMSTDDARTELLKLVGVGRKVADCVLLMCLDKREVIPVDTHVHQIAVKHYGMSKSSKAKATMTPKLYDEVNLKLTSVWGDYAGWAHSVLFTSDLKSFSSYGLPSSPPASSAPDSQVAALEVSTAPISSSKKRKKAQVMPEVQVAATLPNEEMTAAGGTVSIQDDSSLVDRIKRRRRGKTS